MSDPTGQSPEDYPPEAGPAGPIIERFGGIRPLAAKLGVPVSTVQGWKKRGHFPANRRAELVAAASQHGVPLSETELEAALSTDAPADGAIEAEIVNEAPRAWSSPDLSAARPRPRDPAPTSAPPP